MVGEEEEEKDESKRGIHRRDDYDGVGEKSPNAHWARPNLNSSCWTGDLGTSAFSRPNKQFPSELDWLLIEFEADLDSFAVYPIVTEVGWYLPLPPGFPIFYGYCSIVNILYHSRYSRLLN